MSNSVMDQINDQLEEAGDGPDLQVEIALEPMSIYELQSVVEELQKAGYGVELQARLRVSFDSWQLKPKDVAP